MNSKLLTGAALIIGLIIAISMAVQVGLGEFQRVYVSSVLIFCIPVLLLLGLRSWYILPFGMLAGLPAMPLFAGKSLSLAELGIIVFSALLLLATMQGRKRFKVKIADWWPMLLYGGWAVLVAAVNGVGLDMLGSDQMGGRRYFTMILAVAGMIGISQMSIQNKEARRVCWLIVLALGITGIYLSAIAYIGERSTGFYSWQQGLSYIGIIGIMFVFAKKSPKQVIKSVGYISLCLFLVAIVLFSGKRMALVVCIFIPIVASFWHRQSVFSAILAVPVFLTISTVVMVQNEVTALPKTVQRALSFIPANWDGDVKQATEKYLFRDTLNRWALISIKENPIIGKGVTLTSVDIKLMEDPNYVHAIKFPEDDPLAFPHIAGKNWHSTWLGLAASFGIPMSIFWIFLQILVLRRSWTLRNHPYSSYWQRVLLALIFFLMVASVVRSLTSGDPAKLAMDGALSLGLLGAVRNGLKKNEINNTWAGSNP